MCNFERLKMFHDITYVEVIYLLNELTRVLFFLSLSLVFFVPFSSAFSVLFCRCRSPWVAAKKPAALPQEWRVE
jgi:hypothetical protein